MTQDFFLEKVYCYKKIWSQEPLLFIENNIPKLSISNFCTEMDKLQR